MAKLIEITGKALSGEWGTDDETGCGIPVLRTTNFTNEGIVNYRNVVTRTITKKKIAEKYLRQGDIIIEKSGGSDKQPVGRVIYFDGPDSTYLFNNFTGLLRVKDRNVWYPRYVFYSLFFNYRRGGTKAFENKTTGLHNLKVDDYVSRCEVRVENIQKQVAICEQLDRIFDIIRARQQQLQKLDELIKARFIPCTYLAQTAVRTLFKARLETGAGIHAPLIVEGKSGRLTPERYKKFVDKVLESVIPEYSKTSRTDLIRASFEGYCRNICGMDIGQVQKILGLQAQQTYEQWYVDYGSRLALLRIEAQLERCHKLLVSDGENLTDRVYLRWRKKRGEQMIIKDKYGVKIDIL